MKFYEDRRLDAVDEMNSNLSRLHYVRNISDRNNYWSHKWTKDFIGDGSQHEMQFIFLCIEFEKARKTETRKRWIEVSRIVLDIAKRHSIRADVMGSHLYELDELKGSLCQGFIYLP